MGYAYIAMKTLQTCMFLPRVIMPCRGFCGGFLTALVVGLLACFAAVPSASAAGPDGSYKLMTATGSLKLGGDSMDIDQEMIKNLIGASQGRLVVSQSQIKLNRSSAVIMMRQLGESFGFQVEASISGPKALTLKKSGTAFVGSTTKPVVVKLNVDIGDDVITGIIRSRFQVRVKGRTMVMTVPVTGELLGKNLTGEVKATFKR
jgi:hypothetical protein